MKMSCIRLSGTMMINAEDVNLLKMTYIFICSNQSGTYGAMGCKQRFYTDPYKTQVLKRELWYERLRIKKLTAFLCFLICGLYWLEL